ncbi:MAG: hypothetical protein EPN41_07515 [Candidimonas sp.]|nr:MAG: hypothetical protein EPN41_07515 [Candidimonas sp.]
MNITYDPIRALVTRHHDLLDQNPYAYFDLRYTYDAEWCAQLCTNAHETDAGHAILAEGQGATPEEACESALKDYQERRPAEEPAVCE